MRCASPSCAHMAAPESGDTPHLPPDRLGLAAGFTAVALWAVYNVGSRHAAGHGFVAADLVVLRFVAAGLIGWPLLAPRSLRDLAGLGWGRGIALTLLAGPLFGLWMASGFMRAPLAHAIVFAPASTLLAILVGQRLLLGERPSRDQLLGAILLLAGLAACGADGFQGDYTGRVFAGDLFYCAGGASWGVFTCLLRLWRVEPFVAAFAVPALPLPVLPILLWASGWHLFSLPTAAILPQLVIQGVFGGFLSMLLFGIAVKRLGAGGSGAFPASVPAAALLLGVPVLGEPLTLLQVTGVLLATLGLLSTIGLLGRLLRRR
ncbi:MAG TPA: DMT family transporter [Geminicoccaceae bacterium]|nr:DMT family transporter [Geminicoccaceae bacterium]